MNKIEIWAKSNGITLKEHTENLLNAIDTFDKLLYLNSTFPQEEFKKLLRFAAFFHDLGKVSPSFQKKIGNENFYKIESFPDIRHNIFSLFFINKEIVKEICNAKDSLFVTFLSAIAFHHWKVDEKEYLLNINDTLIKVSNLLLDEGEKGIRKGDELSTLLIKHFDNFEVSGFQAKDLIAFDEHLAKHLAKEGNLISLDIIPPYTLYFLPEKLRAEIELKIDLNLWIFLSGFLLRADHYVSLIEQNLVPLSLNEIEKPIPSFGVEKKLEQNFGENFWQKIANNFKNKNLILIAPTGLGKTEFAFLWAEENKVFYTLPLRVATNQIYERACYFFNKKQNIPEDLFVNENVGLLHSDADLYLLEKSDISKHDLDGENLRILELSRHFSLPLNICTGDQIFPAALKYPQYEKIYATLGYSKLVVDEVQAYNPKACAVVVKIIEDIVALGGKFLLITATLPTFVKDYLIKEKNIILENEIINLYSPDNPVNIKIKTDFKHKIKIQNKDIEKDIDKIIEKAEAGNRILIVLNTINKAEKIYKLIKNKITHKNDIYMALIHSKFTLQERKIIEKDLEKNFINPKPKNERIPKILVSTQVVEVSLDIDADYLYTEIAPIDSLIQRMGRVLRRVNILSNKIKNTNDEFNYKDYYPNYEPNIYIYYQTDTLNSIKESGEGRIYEQGLLHATFEILKDKIEIMENEKQDLVEKVYSQMEKSNYLKKFYETLDILNAGYISDSKYEAHKLFREIYTISVIEESKIDEINEKINKKILENNHITWLWFKKEIIAPYVINDYIWEYAEHELKPLWQRLSLKSKLSKINKRRLKNYCEGIWITPKIKRKTINFEEICNIKNYQENIL